MALDLDIVALDDADGTLIDEVAFARRDELARRHGFQHIKDARQGLARFQDEVVRRIDLLDVVRAFDIKDGIQFFDLDAAADELEDDFSAVALTEAVHGPWPD